MTSPFVIGVDGGGSKTRAKLETLDGSLRAEGVAGSSNAHVVGEAAAREALRMAVDRARGSAGVRDDAVAEAACVGLAGCDNDEELALARQSVRHDARARAIEVVHDSDLVLTAGTPAGLGIAVIAGTGSVAVGRGSGGARVRAGGWGWILGDEGSGFDMGWRALRLATQTADGRADAHELLAAVARVWNVPRPAGLIEHAHRFGDAMRFEVAKIARVVVELAPRDPHARGLVIAAAGELAKLVDAVATRLLLEAPPLALGGSILAHCELARTELLARARSELGAVRIVLDPCDGALSIARRMCGA